MGLGVNVPATGCGSWQPTKTFEGHQLSVTSVKMHSKKPIVATVSDDRTWMLWALPGGELILKGQGHTDWISSCDFNPQGTQLVTGSGGHVCQALGLRHSTVCCYIHRP